MSESHKPQGPDTSDFEMMGCGCAVMIFLLLVIPLLGIIVIARTDY
ncbi:hypothetical protein [Streptomyces sp. SAJ15]|nr:hypothetical protein [Streptomyces sp. SAJ15]